MNRNKRQFVHEFSDRRVLEFHKTLIFRQITCISIEILSFNIFLNSRSHSFDYMNRDKRQFVHELSDHFGIESESYDAEPKRNVVATAVKDRAWLPSQSIMDVVLGVRKAPVPVSIALSQP